MVAKSRKSSAVSRKSPSAKSKMDECCGKGDCCDDGKGKKKAESCCCC